MTSNKIGKKAIQSAGRDTRTAIAGTVAQFVLAATVLFLYLATDAAVLGSLAAYAFCGMVLWLAVWIAIELARGAAMEAFELEARTEADARGERTEPALFDNPADARPASRRSARYRRFGIPTASCLFGASLVSVGFLLQRDPEFDSVPVVSPATYAGYGALISFVGFVTGRYLLGVGSVTAKPLLRGGASFVLSVVLGVFLTTIALACGHSELWLPLHWFTIGVPFVALVVGVEVLVQVVLGFYRPRRRGEEPRPAFDSRLLAFASSPGNLFERLQSGLNYQFGFEISRSWFWALLSRSAGSLLVFGVAVLLALSSIVVVEPHQQALVLRLGRLEGPPLGPGLHWKWPWPVAEVERFDVTTLRSLVVGSHQGVEPGQPILWSNRHATGGERLLMVSPPQDFRGGATAPPVTTASQAPAVALVGTEIFVEYRIVDVIQYATAHADADARLRAIADREVTRYLLRLDIDQLLGPQRIDTARALRERLRQAASNERLGLEVVWVGVAGVHPAQQVASAFHETIGAEQEMQTSIEKGRRESTRILAESVGTESFANAIVRKIEELERLEYQSATREAVLGKEQQIEALLRRAGGKAAEEVASARAERTRIESAARGRAEAFRSELRAYRAAPRYYSTRRGLDVLSRGLAGARKYFLATDRDDLTIRGDLKDVRSGFEGLYLEENASESGDP